MLFDSLTNNQKWSVALVVSVCFIIVVSPIVLGVLSKVGNIVGINMLTSGGCVSLIGMLVQVVLFFLIIRLVMHVFSKPTKEKFNDSFSCCGNNSSTMTEMEKVINKNYPPFTGLAAPGDMARCNGAQLIAEDNGSPACVDAARQCLSDPFSDECKNKLNICVDADPDKPALGKLVMDNCGFAFRRF